MLCGVQGGIKKNPDSPMCLSGLIQSPIVLKESLIFFADIDFVVKINLDVPLREKDVVCYEVVAVI